MLLNRSKFWALFLLGIVLLSCAVDARRDRDDVERGSDSDAKEKLDKQSRSGGDRTGLNDLKRVKLGKRLAADGSFKSVPIVVTAADGSVRVVDVAISGVPVPSLRVRVLSEDDLGTGSGAGITSKGKDDDEDDKLEFEDDDDDEESSGSDGSGSNDEQDEIERENEAVQSLGQLDLDDVDLDAELQFVIKLVGFIEYSNGNLSQTSGFEFGVDEIVQYKSARSSVLNETSSWTVNATTVYVENATIIVVSASHTTGKVELSAYVSDSDVTYAGHQLNQQDVKIDFKFDPEVFNSTVSAANYFAAVLKLQYASDSCKEEDYSVNATKLLAAGAIPEKNDWQCTASTVGGYLNWDRTLTAKLTTGEEVLVDILSSSYDASTFPLDQPVSSGSATVLKDGDDDSGSGSGSNSSGSGSSGSGSGDSGSGGSGSSGSGSSESGSGSSGKEDSDSDGISDDVETESDFSSEQEDELSKAKLDKGRVFVFSADRVLANVDYFFWDPKTGVMDQMMADQGDNKGNPNSASSTSYFVSFALAALMLVFL